MGRSVLIFFAFAAVCSFAQGNRVQFNRDVRPILSDRCFTCHGPDRAARKSELRIDLESNVKQRQRSGRIGIVPGSPDQSEIYRRITSNNNALRMPPAYMGHERLPQPAIDTIRRWIEQGGEYQPHWSLIPPKRVAALTVDEPEWSRNPIDGFVLSRLRKDGLSHSLEADRTTLIRRVTLDLTGLPPTPADVERFVQDTSANAYEKLIDRLLASPRYGERMAIRWLEAARYSDTNGYQTDGPRDMWRWRDWVISAFNRNMPFDQFTVEQLAGDLLPNATLDQQIATAFHRNHRTSAEGGIVDEEFRVEYVADRTETTGTVWLGMTVGCARCHDHKYDPITQKEFYQLFAFFNNVPERGFVYNFGNEEPYIKAPLPEQQKRLDAFDARLADLGARLASHEGMIEEARRRWEASVRNGDEDWTPTAGMTYRREQASRFDGADFVNAGPDIAHFNYQDPFSFAAWINPESPTGAILSRAEDYPEGSGHGLHLMNGKLRLHVIFRWTDLGMRLETVDPLPMNRRQHVLVTYDGGMKAAGVHIYVDGHEWPVKVLFDQCIWPIDVKEPFRIGAGAGLRFKGEIADVRVYDRALTSEEASTIAVGESVSVVAKNEAKTRTKAQQNKLNLCFAERHFPARAAMVREQIRQIEAERKKYLAGVPTVMVMRERPNRRPTFLLKRGAYDAPGDPVDPATPASLPAMPVSLPKNRLGLAKWLVDRNHPLTARVTVNRFWQMLFGTGIVKTVEDFGSQGEWPVHPELLDWLAVEFMESGWDVKQILKTMVMSAAYRQSSRATQDLLEKDPDNRLLARGPRFRVSPEMIRDQALAWSGLLVEQVGGPSVKPYQPPGLWQELQGGSGYKPDHGQSLYRRSLYSYWKRTVAPPGMVVFDSPNREVCTVRESRTNTPLQALNSMNDVIYLEAARNLAQRALKDGGVQSVFRTVLARSPKPAELLILNSALARFRAEFAKDPGSAAKFIQQGESPRDPSLSTTDFAAYTALASLIMNMDEAITKQ